MKRRIVLGLWIILLTACDPDSSQIGTNFFQEGVLDFSSMDSVSVKLSTIHFENLTTNSAARLLIGNHRDEKLGRITASPYFQISTTSENTLKEANASYDYLALVLKYDRYVYYDTTASLTLHVRKVTEEMKLNSSNTLYGTDRFATETSELGQITFAPKPHRQDSIVIKLSDTWGEELFAKAKAGNSQLTSTEDFRKYLKGLAVLTDTTVSACLVGLETTPELRLYYKDKNTTPVSSKHLTFAAATTSVQFTAMDVNRKDTRLAVPFTAQTRLSASATDDEAYLQAGGGLALRIDMPYLRNLKQLPNFYLTQALLEVYVSRKSYTETTPLPTSLTVYTANRKNDFYGQYTSNATLSLDTDLGRDTRYVLDVTSFVKTQMETAETNENSLVFMLPENFPVSADRLYATMKTGDNKTGLKIYFVTVNN
jgi:hypothetical protein